MSASILVHLFSFLLCPGLNLVAGLVEENDTSPPHFRHISHFIQSLFHPSSVGQLGIDIMPRSIDSCLRAIKLSARIYSRWAERRAKKLSPPAHVRGQRVKKGSVTEGQL